MVLIVYLQVSKSACILTTQVIMKLLKSKEAAAAVDIKTWPTILDTGIECLPSSQNVNGLKTYLLYYTIAASLKGCILYCIDLAV